MFPREDEPAGVPWSVSAETARLIEQVLPYTMTDPLKLANLHGLATELVQEGIPGDIVECGVCNGGSAAVLAGAIRRCSDRRIWLYDTFEGIPAPSAEDGAHAKGYAGDFVGEIRLVKEAVAGVGFPLSRLVLRQGLFKETFVDPLPPHVALLHIDADWYESVLQALEVFYPRVSKGGIILLDDFGWWEGCRKAFYRFCQDHRLEPLLERVGHSQAYWRKAAEHNRGRVANFRRGIYRPDGGSVSKSRPAARP